MVGLVVNFMQLLKGSHSSVFLIGLLSVAALLRFPIHCFCVLASLPITASPIFFLQSSSIP